MITNVSCQGEARPTLPAGVGTNSYHETITMSSASPRGRGGGASGVSFYRLMKGLDLLVN